MLTKMGLRALIAVCLLALASPAWSQTKLGFDGEEAASVGIYIKNLQTGQVVANCDEYRALLPASVMKSITAAAAIYSLGADFQFITPVVLSGKASDNYSAWIGNLVVKSCGDPTIDSELFKDRAAFSSEIVSGLKSLGITSISGKIIIDQPMPQQGCIPGWQIDDVAYPYGAGWYGFNYRDNYYSLWPATKETKPYVPGLSVTVIPAKSNDLVRGVFSDNLIVYARDPKNSKWKVNVSMNDPALVFKAELAEKLRAAGIKLLDKDESNASGSEDLLVTEHSSPKIASALRKMMHESHNLFAEGYLRALAPGETREKAIAADYDALEALGVDIDFNRICDGSGLARANRLQPIFISNVLEAAAAGDKGQAYVSLFPKAGVEGTVRGLLAKTSLKGKYALKSGSMSSVQCYAGYKLDSEGNPTHTVVILINGFLCPRAEVRGAIERLLTSIK